MALKTFNLDEKIYKEFSKHCKKNGISMSKKVENFIKEELGKINFKRRVFSKKKVIPEEHSFSKYC